MTIEDDDSELQRELSEVEELIASVRRDLSANVEETPDSADAGSNLTNTAEDQAVLESLEARRDRLRAQLSTN